MAVRFFLIPLSVIETQVIDTGGYRREEPGWAEDGHRRHAMPVSGKANQWGEELDTEERDNLDNLLGSWVG